MSAPILLCDTAGMPEERWLECRAHGPRGDIEYTLGGSDVAAVFGVSPWTTPLELWMIKKGRMKPKKSDNADQLKMGHLLEPIIAYWYAQKSGNEFIEDTGLYQHADHPYALGNFDGRFRRPDGQKGITEFKSTTYHKADAWADDAIPLYYELQLRYYLGIDDCELGDFACLWGTNPGTDMATPSIVRDKAKEDIIFEKCDQFIWSLVHDKPPTMADVKPKLALASLARIYGASQSALPTIEFPKKFEVPLRKIAELQTENSGLSAKIKANEAKIEAHSVRIAELMKAHEHGVLETTKDKLLVDFVTKTTRRVDSALLKKDFPDAYRDTLKTSESRKVKVSIQPV